MKFAEHKSKAIFYALTCLFIILLVCVYFQYLCTPAVKQIRSETTEYVDLTTFDFTNQTAQILKTDSDAAVVYPENFYTPADFAANKVNDSVISYGKTGGEQKEYGTVRILIRLPPNQIYAITSKNASFAQRLFINGEERKSIGVPGKDKESTKPKTLRYVESFKPVTETTEIVIHYANFVHADSGGIYPMNIGHVENILHSEQLILMRTFSGIIALSVAMLIFIELFISFPKNRYLLWFALICGCASFRELFLNNKIIMLLFPDLNWYLAIRLEYLLTLLLVLFSVFYIYELFPNSMRKKFMQISLILCLSFSLLLLTISPRVISRYVISLTIVAILPAVCMLVSIGIEALKKTLQSTLSKKEQFLLLIGLLIYAVFSLAGIYTQNEKKYIWGLEYPHIAAIIFLFFNILVLIMGFSRTQDKLEAANKNQKIMQETNQMLERLNKIKADFLGDISHEMKTPLTVMSNCAGLTLAQIRKKAVTKETEYQLDEIQQEAVRLGRLVEQLMQVATEKQRQLILTETNVDMLLERVANFCEPICRGRHNQLKVEVNPSGMKLKMNTDAVFQVLINLITNANRQMNHGVIFLSAHKKINESSISFQVADTGAGIAPNLLKHVFERGVSGDGGTGLGLAICKEIVEDHAGSISIQSSAKGTQVHFLLPYTQQEVSE